MLLNELLTENFDYLVANYYVEADKEQDERLNPVAASFANRTRDRYREFYADENSIPVFDKPAKSNAPKYDNIPSDGRCASAGLRGNRMALKRAGLPGSIGDGE